MPDPEGFLHAIRARPDDDAPRLVYADWLEENGDPARAEFIRVQCELARMSLWDRRRPALMRHEYELFARHGKRWSAPLVGRVMRWRYRRGFVEQVKVTVAQLREAAAMLATNFPIRALHVKYPEQSELPELATGLEELGGVEALDLSHARIGDRGLRVLLDSSASLGLRSLKLPWCGLTDASLTVLAGTKRLPSLEEINLAGNDGLTEGGAATFLATCRLPKLSRVRWEHPAYDWPDEKLSALAGSPLLPRLKELTRSTRQRTPPDAVLSALLEDGPLDSVEHLRAGHLTLDGVRRLAGNPSLRRLRRLNLPGGSFGSAGVAALLASPLVDSLEELHLGGGEIDWRGTRAIARSPRLSKLAFLDMGDNPIGDGGCRALGAEGALPGLQGLELTDGNMTAKGARALINSPLAGRLGYLNVEGADPFLLRSGHQLLIDCFGEYLEYDGRNAFYSMRWARAHARSNPPRCLSGFALRADSPLEGQLLKNHLRGEPAGTAVFEILPPDETQRPVLLVYWHRWGKRARDRVAVPPMAVRWEPSGEVVELFDSQQHGFAGELDFSATVTGTGPRSEWTCGHRGCREHTLFACFCYWGDTPVRPRDRYLPPQEQYRGFELYAYCRDRDAFECVGGFECK